MQSGELPAGIDPSVLEKENFSERLLEFSKLARDTLTSDERGNVKTKSKGYILDIGKLTNPDFEIPHTPDLPHDPPVQP